MFRPRTRTMLRYVREASATVLADGRGPVLAVVALGWLLVSGTRFVVPALLPQITTTFAVSNTAAGFAVTLVWLTYAVLQFPAGLLTDRWGERTLLLLSIVVGTGSVLAFAVAPVFGVFLGACLLLGVGIGLFGLPRVTLLARVYPRNDGTALGVTFAAGNVGSVVLPFVAVLVSSRYGWRAGIGVTAPLFLLVFGGLWRLVSRRSVDARAVDASPGRAVRQIAASLTDRAVLLLGAVLTFVVFTWQGFTAFFPTYLVAEKGLDQGMATTLYGVFFGTAAVVQPLAGKAGDRYGYRPLLLAFAGTATLTVLVLPFVDGLAVLTVLAVLLGLRAGVGPLNNAYLVAVLPDEVEGVSYGLLRTVYLGIGATGSVAVGAFADADLFDEAFLFLGGLTAVVFGLYVLLPSRPDV